MNAPLFWLSLRMAAGSLDGDSLHYLAIWAWQRTEYGSWVMS